MLQGLRIVVVMPAYNAERTLRQTVAEIDRTIVDEIILVDDCSEDRTVLVAKELGLKVIRHTKNAGYGANQKSCYRSALELGADIVVMVHPDYQYTPKLIPAMAAMLANDVFDVSLGSRIVGGTALSGGMPLYKYVANRFLTLVQNLLTGMKLSEFHTGYRAFKAKVLRALPLSDNSDGFSFDNQVLVQCHYQGFRIGEISCPTKYFKEASSINFVNSCGYGLSCLWISVQYLLARMGLYQSRLFQKGILYNQHSKTPQQEKACGRSNFV